MSASWHNDDQLVDLMVKEAMEGLTADEARELQRLSASLSVAERESIESMVAALFIASDRGARKMPAGLRDRIVQSAPSRGVAANVVDLPRPGGISRGYSLAGWWAAAACLVLAVAGWWPRLLGDGAVSQVAMTPEEQRAQLLASGRALEAAWSPDMPIAGDVVFDPVTQRGFLRFRGIPANDPRLAQYQLWIADAGRPQPEPVDGGVFDVSSTADGDVIIPFEAKLPVDKPAAFVVTLEQPGGVVVSKQEKVMTLATVPTT